VSQAVHIFTSRLVAAVCVTGSLLASGGPRVVTTPPPAPAPVAVAPKPTPIDLTKPPALGAPPTLRMPAITTRELANGLKIVIIEQHELPLVDVLLQVRS